MYAPRAIIVLEGTESVSGSLASVRHRTLCGKAVLSAAGHFLTKMLGCK